MERLYFACRVRLNGSDTFVIWFQDERDGFVRHSDGHLVAAEAFAAAWRRPFPVEIVERVGQQLGLMQGGS
jgi:hypothetical protein